MKPCNVLGKKKQDLVEFISTKNETEPGRDQVSSPWKTQSYHDECIIFELFYSYISCVRMKLIWSTTFRTTLGWILYILTTCSTFLLQFVNSGGITVHSIGLGLGFTLNPLGTRSDMADLKPSCQVWVGYPLYP